jgi:hypothetical protein
VRSVGITAPWARPAEWSGKAEVVSGTPKAKRRHQAETEALVQPCYSVFSSRNGVGFP